MLGWCDGERPVLLLEDLSGCSWPPPWDARGVDHVLTALEQLRAADPGGVLSPLSETDRELSGGWRRVITEPTAFLSLGLATARWVRENGPALADAADGAVIDGPCPTHQDVRSDNLCFRGERALLVDWNLAVLAHADYDIAFWLPSLHAEGGPAPEEILPDAGPLAAVISGFSPHGPASRRSRRRRRFGWCSASSSAPRCRGRCARWSWSRSTGRRRGRLWRDNQDENPMSQRDTGWAVP